MATSSSPAKTPLVVKTRFHSRMRFPAPSRIATSMEPTTLGFSCGLTTIALNLTVFPGLQDDDVIFFPFFVGFMKVSLVL